MNEKILAECGLTIQQAKIYLYLIENGLSSAKVLCKKTGIGRALTYKVLEQLIEIGLVKKRDDIGKITLFFPEHPQRLKEIVENKKRESEIADSGLKNIFGFLLSEFNTLSGKPNIKFYEGTEGFKKTNELILDTNKDISIITSPIHKNNEEIMKIVGDQIQKQIKQNIKTHVISPIKDEVTIDTERDKRNLVTRRKISEKKLAIPAQITIMEGIVSITNFKDNLITVIIESKDISETFQKIFDYMWDRTQY